MSYLNGVFPLFNDKITHCKPSVSQEVLRCADTANFASILTVLQVSQPIQSLKDLTSRNGEPTRSHLP